MVIKRRRTMPIAGAIGIGVAVSFLLTLVGAAVLAMLVEQGTVAQNGMGGGAMVILVLCAAMGALAATLLFPGKRLAVCGLTALGYYLSLLAMTALLFGGQYEGMGVTALMILLGGALTVLPVFFGKGRKKGPKIPSYR